MPTLPPAGREYVTATLTGAPVGVAIEVTLDLTTWYPTVRTGDTVRFLAAGPDATGNPAGTVVLAAGRNRVRARATDTPEVIIRDAGVIDVG